MPEDNETTPLDNTSPESNPDPLGIIGWVIGGKYKVVSHLGGGGFGEVYEGYNENLPEQRLVIKFFKRVQAREKFAKEAKILCMLDHANICRVIDYLPEEGAVVVSYIDGKDGGVILKESGALPEQLFLKVARSITSAIAYAHEKKIAHRDIKPGNIIIDKSENVFLIDFGIAKEMGTDATKTAYTALTPMFAAPERQAGDKHYNPFISDVYETGITLFNLVTNSLPYRNPTNPLVEEWGGIAARKLSPELTRILKKATHPDPAKRYASAAAMAEDLKNLKSAFGRPKKRSPLPIVAGVVIILAVAGYFLKGQISDMWSSMFSPGETAQVVETPDEASQEAEGIEEDGFMTEEAVTGDDMEQDQPVETPEEIPLQTPVKEQPVIEEEQQADDTPAQEVQQPVVQEEVVAEEPEPEPEPTPPPPPPKSNIAVSVIPSDGIYLAVNGSEEQSGVRFESSPGSHNVMVIHRDYPIYRGNIDAAEGVFDITLDLAELTGPIDTVDLQVALIPPSENHMLELTRNGRKESIFNFPNLDLQQLSGEWNIGMNVKAIGAAAGTGAQVDSCIIFPFNPARRDVVRGNAGILKVDTSNNGDVSVARLLIYWSET